MATSVLLDTAYALAALIFPISSLAVLVGPEPFNRREKDGTATARRIPAMATTSRSSMMVKLVRFIFELSFSGQEV